MVLKRLLIIDDEENILLTLKGALEDEGYVVEVAKSGALGLQKIKDFSPDVIMLDIWMPDEDGIQVLKKIKEMDKSIDVIMMSGHGTIETAVKSIRWGAYDFLEKPLHFDKVLVLLDHLFERTDLKIENLSLKQELHEQEKLIGESPAVVRLKKLIEVTAPSNGWVMIYGENGTGKELVARSLHQGSPRRQGRFVAVNCAAIPEDLIESELFGHEKGAFTGAFERKIGKFEQAHGGTLFLDEVGDMGAKAQAKILRALQECQIQRVGGHETITVDVRVVAATNKDLKQSIRNGEFREDLYYRLNVIPILVPALRERKADIPLLLNYFLQKYSLTKMPTVSPELISLLQSYEWPGNVRELKNWIERACILSQEESMEDVAARDFGKVSERLVDAAFFAGLKEARADFERKFIMQKLEEFGGNISRTAQAIGLERSHLHKKIRFYGIESMGN